MVTRTSEFTLLPLPSMGVLRFAGPDARKFLQGQLSNDVEKLAPGVLMHAGFHNAQGRVLAVLRLGMVEDAVLAIMPAELIDAIARQLGRFVLRAKVQISDASQALRVIGVAGGAPRADAGTWLPLAGTDPLRGYLVQSAAGAQALDAETADETSWTLQEIGDGLPQVFAGTSGEFVAQMLNLDCIDGISFTKGCYTGQEIIARSHYRGRIKRRMQRFRTRAPLLLHAGDTRRLADGRSIQVVRSATLPDGRSEFLAVAPLTAQPAADAIATSPEAPLSCESLPLPYALPD